MGSRFKASGAWWPAGTVFSASIVVILALGYTAFLAGAPRKDV
jgi:hypothetical protein